MRVGAKAPANASLSQLSFRYGAHRSPIVREMQGDKGSTAPRGLAQGLRCFSPRRRHNNGAQTGMLLVESCSPQPMAAEQDLQLALACAALENPNITPDVCSGLVPSPALGAD